MQNKTVISILLGPAFILLLPLEAMQFTDEVAWSPADFAVAWVLMVGTGLAYKLATRHTDNLAYRTAVAVALASGLILVWMNLAVGLIGNEDNPANLMYGGVIAVGIIGAIIARFQAQGMARAMFATALAQGFIPVIALILWKARITMAEFGLNACFVIPFVASALLFRRATRGVKGPAGVGND